MRTLALLTALLFLALQAQARTLQETADQVPAQNQPDIKDKGELWAEDQDQAEDGDRDMAISFTGEERLTRAAGACTCRRNLFCRMLKFFSGSCKIFGHRHRLCCQ